MGDTARHIRNILTTINLIAWLVVGDLIAWVDSLIVRTDGQQGAFVNFVVGIIGSAVGGGSSHYWSACLPINQDAFSAGAVMVLLSAR